jgi:hypothetical protein
MSSPIRPPVPVCRRWRRTLLAALFCGGLAAAPTPGEANPRLVEWIRRWLGNPPIASPIVRGSPPPISICLLHPWLSPQAPPRDELAVPLPLPRADLAVPRPVLATTTLLSRITLRDGSGRFFKGAAPPLSAKASGTQMAWPPHWPSLEPGRRYELSLVAASSGDDGVTIEIQAASAEAFEQVRRLQQRLGSDPSAWEQQIRVLLTSGNPPSHPSRALAAQLLFSQQALSSPELEQLRQTLQRGRCSTPSGASPQGSPP